MYPNYPNQPGYPTQPNPYGYGQDPNQGYPSGGNTVGFNMPSGFDSQPSYPAYPSTQPGYPPTQPGYPPTQPGYPPTQPGYPPTQPTYPGGSYPSTQPGYPGQPGGGYPPTQPGYPSQPGGYPSQSLNNQSWFDPVPQTQGYLPAHIQSNPNFQPNQPNFNNQSIHPTAPAPFNQHGNNQPQINNQPVSNYQPSANPTLHPYSPFNPNDDCAKLYKAMKGIGTDETTLIDILCRRTSAQRQELLLCYKTGYGKDLLKNLESELKGDFERLFKSLMRPAAHTEAKDLMHAIDGIGTNEAVLIDIICTKNNAEMIELKNAFKLLFNKDLEKELRGESSGYFKRFLVSLSAAHRSEQPADPAKALQQAKELYEAGAKQIGTNEVVFNRIFASESFAQLRAIFENYYRLTGHDIEKAIKSEMSGDVERAFLAVAQTAKNPAIYWANRLKDTMAGVGTQDRSLIRIIALRSERDMQDIKREFQSRFGKTLESQIKNECSGDYKRGLLCLIGDPHWR